MRSTFGGLLASLAWVALAAVPLAGQHVTAEQWSLTIEHDELGERIVVLEGDLTERIRDYDKVSLHLQTGTECDWVFNCAQSTCEFGCPCGLLCSWVYLPILEISPDLPNASATGSSYAISLQAKGRRITVTIELFEEFFPAGTAVHHLQVSVEGDGPGTAWLNTTQRFEFLLT